MGKDQVVSKHILNALSLFSTALGTLELTQI